MKHLCTLRNKEHKDRRRKQRTKNKGRTGRMRYALSGCVGKVAAGAHVVVRFVLGSNTEFPG